MGMTENQSRYEGKPMLRLLESYVLWAIGELPAENAKTLEGMVPTLEKVYGVSGSWVEIIEKVMGFPPSLPGALKQLWEKNTAIAKANDVHLSAQQFAEVAVDQNLAG